ncbi:MFS transporter [Rhizomonospora bruguierae]|uniref:MFS transporter n=1 Tax=Rhizomonospora bruguierae TaxID=1581705 RepID=UPI001BCF9860|nr:MFS transporter [Micromonospora sp. NBRC 107566]
MRGQVVRRPAAFVLALLVAALAVVWPVSGPAQAALPDRAPGPGDLCTTQEWQTDFRTCVAKLKAETDNTVQCLKPPVPSAPDSGFAGWFASKPSTDPKTIASGKYSDYGYAGYSYTTYDVDGGCASGLLHPEYKFWNTIANGEFMIATGVIGASNALRERAWNPQTMWGWADPLVKNATQSIYNKVFSVFGIITLAVVGLYLIWRSRQSDMSNAMTTAGWAVLVMVGVTALSLWPVRAANLADSTLVHTLDVVHSAVGPRAYEPRPGECLDPNRCKDLRDPAVRASDTATETMLYRNWLRGALGSADSDTAKKYGEALYDAKSLTWGEAASIKANPNTRDSTIAAKQRQWATVASQIKKEDPEAYEYLKGVQDLDRVGAGFIAVLASLLFAMFDLTASVLVLLGFLIFRWAVVATPILGTVGLLRPASAGLRRLANAVVAAVFNIAIFGTGAAVYLFAVDLIMSTPSLAGWLQVVLVWLCGVVGWLLLRPYRRITQLGGKDSTAAVTGSWHRRFFRDIREAAKLNVVEPGGTAEPAMGRRRQVVAEQGNLRPEARREDAGSSAGRDGATPLSQPAPERYESSPERVPVGAPEVDTAPARATTAPRRRASGQWTSPDVPDGPRTYTIYRPDTGDTVEARPEPPRIRTEAR